MAVSHTTEEKSRSRIAAHRESESTPVFDRNKSIPENASTITRIRLAQAEAKSASDGGRIGSTAATEKTAPEATAAIKTGKDERDDRTDEI
jgi:hypothetical protein